MLKKQYQKAKSVCKVTFTLPVDAIDAKDVRVLGDFNDWNWEAGYKMKAAKGEFKAVAEIPTGNRYEFRYMAANGAWENDHQADAYVASPFAGVENSVIAVDEVADAPVKKTAAKKTAAKKATTKPAAAKKTAAKKTTTKKAATKAKADDLKKIEGIGPKIAGLLNEAGIVTFKDLATAKESKVQGVLDAAGPRFRMHKPATWAEQAKLAADGKWEELKTLQVELNGGKRK